MESVNKDVFKKIVKERRPIQNQEKRAEIPWIHDEERGLGKLNLYGAY